MHMMMNDRPTVKTTRRRYDVAVAGRAEVLSDGYAVIDNVTGAAVAHRRYATDAVALADALNAGLDVSLDERDPDGYAALLAGDGDRGHATEPAPIDALGDAPGEWCEVCDQFHPDCGDWWDTWTDDAIQALWDSTYAGGGPGVGHRSINVSPEDEARMYGGHPG